MQKMYPNESVKMLHVKFRNVYPSLSISYTLFSTMRPFWTVPEKVTERSTCLCTKHENMNLLIRSLHQEHVLGQNCEPTLINTLTCTPCQERCLARTCLKCNEKQIIFKDGDDNKLLNIQEWVVVKETRESFKTHKEICVQRTIKKTYQQNVGQLKQKLKENIRPFLGHVLRITHQDKELKMLNFSKTYNCKYAAEPQTVHFGASRQSISLHSGVCYLQNEYQSFCTTTELLRHDPSAVIAHLLPVLEQILKKRPQITHLHFLSDGPTAQYRNEVIFALLTGYLGNLICIRVIPYQIGQKIIDHF